MPEQIAARIPTAEQRLENAKSTLALLTLITHGFYQADEIGGYRQTLDSDAWSRLNDICHGAYNDVQAAIEAIAKAHTLQIEAPDVAEVE